MMEVKTRVETGPCVLVAPDGRSLVSETTITSYDDWWETPIGRMNFGRVHISRPVHYMVYADGRKEPTTPMAFALTALEPKKQKRTSLMKWLFG